MRFPERPQVLSRRGPSPPAEAAIAAAILAALAASPPAQQTPIRLDVRRCEAERASPIARGVAIAQATSTPEFAQFDDLVGQAFATDFTSSLALGDVDGDGDLDLVVGNSGQWYQGSGAQSRLYRNDGRGTFSDVTTTHLPVAVYRTRAVALGDVDGDGDLDLVLGNAEQNRLYLNDGTGTFTDVTASKLPPAFGNDTRALALGDVDGDGDLDLVAGSADLFSLGAGQQSRLYLNDGSGAYTDATATHLPAVEHQTRALALGDLDGDGDLDLVLGNYLQQSRLWLNDGQGVFADVTAARLPVNSDNTHAVALGDVDVDGDGDLDLVAGTGFLYMTYGGLNRLYLNDGSATFTDVTAARLPPAWDMTMGLALGDVDGDGDLDLVTANGYDFRGPYGEEVFGPTERNGLFLNDGAGTFAEATFLITAPPDYTNAVALGDVDRDGDLDLVAGDYAEPSRLYLNLLRQLDTPSPPQLGQAYAFDAYARYGFASATDVAYPFLAVATGSFPTVFGTFGLGPPIIVALPPIAIPQPAGVGSLSLAIPNDQAFVGIPLYAQALIVQPGSIRLTNVTGDVIGP